MLLPLLLPLGRLEVVWSSWGKPALPMVEDPMVEDPMVEKSMVDDRNPLSPSNASVAKRNTWCGSAVKIEVVWVGVLWT